DKEMEGRIVSGVTYNRNEARITISGVPDQPGIATKIFTPISNADIIVDMIIQNQDTGNGMTDMTFTVLRSDYERTLKLLESVVESTEATGGVNGSKTITKISIVGVGMRNHSGIASTMFSVLANEGINISMISTSEIKVSCIIEEKYTELAIRALHDAFELDKNIVAEEETLV
ncbi:MAG TPA: ACT domain-containing protein, partial [Desulfobacterales bacterium]|nr:ACT domain-containing protein [Desulfobacterales bacterium]